MDFRDDLKLPPQDIAEISAGAKAAAADQFGVRQVEQRPTLTRCG
jgi:hypothetical protein